MQWLVGALLAGLSRLFFSKGGQWITQILLALGIGFATKEFAVDPLLDEIQSAVSGLPSAALEWFGYLNLDVYMVAVVSAHAASAIKNVILRKLT